MSDATAAGNALVDCARLSRSYPDGKERIHALVDFTYRFVGGSMIAVTGPSGSGKSTLLALIAAMDYADSGEVHVGGTELGSLSTVEQAEIRATHVSYLFPSWNLIPVLSVYENLSLALSRKQLAEPVIDARIKETLEYLNVSEIAHRRPVDLSSGQRARAALARAIAVGNPVLVADEPTAHLDRENSRVVADLLRSVASDPLRVVIVATHDALVAETAHERIDLRDGRIAGSQAAR